MSDEELVGCDIVATMGCSTLDLDPAAGVAVRDWALDDPAGKTSWRVREIRDERERLVVELFDEVESAHRQRATTNGHPPMPDVEGILPASMERPPVSSDRDGLRRRLAGRGLRNGLAAHGFGVCPAIEVEHGHAHVEVDERADDESQRRDHVQDPN